MSHPTLRRISAESAKALLDRGGAVLIDVREADEHARERVEGARLAPLSQFDPQAFAGERSKIAVFHCNSGNRTKLAADQLLSAGFAQTFELEGGLVAWKRAGLPVVVDARAPLPIMRQVQIATGSMVVLGVILAVLVSPWFMVLSALVGAGLVMAGVTGFCGLAHLLARMPWNRHSGAAASPEPTQHAPAR